MSIAARDLGEGANALIPAAGHQLVPEAAKAVRGDSFVVETTIHDPTESSLIGDGLRKVVTLAAALAEQYDQPGWRQHQHVLKNLKDIVCAIGRIARAKSQGADRLKPGYQRLLSLAEDLLERGCHLLQTLAFAVEPLGQDWPAL